MKFIRFGERYNCNDGYLQDLSMIFIEPLVKEYLTRPDFYEYRGNYIRLTLLENGKLSFGTVFDEPEDDTVFLDKKIIIKLLDQLENLNKQKFRVIYLINSNGYLEFTSKFPTKYALFSSCGQGYELTKCDDPHLKFLADFLLHYKKLDNYEAFLDFDSFQIENINWDLGDLQLKWRGNEILFFDDNNEIKIKLKDLIILMNEWLNLLDAKSDKIYLLLENGEYRLTTDYFPE